MDYNNKLDRANIRVVYINIHSYTYSEVDIAFYVVNEYSWSLDHLTVLAPLKGHVVRLESSFTMFPFYITGPTTVG